MANTIPAPQLGKQLDKTLQALYEAEAEDNKGLILYIRNGELAFDTEDNLFSVEVLT